MAGHRVAAVSCGPARAADRMTQPTWLRTTKERRPLPSAQARKAPTAKLSAPKAARDDPMPAREQRRINRYRPAPAGRRWSKARTSGSVSTSMGTQK